MIIMTAYNPEPPIRWGAAKLLNAPGWVTQDMYDIDARVALADVEAWQKQDMAYPVLLKSALQETLKVRCHLSLHVIPSEIRYLDLVVGKHGLKIKEMLPGESIPKVGMTFPGGGKMAIEQHEGRLVKRFYGVRMKEFALLLSQVSGDRPVQDKTGLTGRYDFTWQERDSTESNTDPGGALYNWPIDSLGLALKPGIGPANTFVVDHIEKPDNN
jgi:uncharacterized protein (TIGR03435 family)